MNFVPEKQQQVTQIHASLIIAVVTAINDPSLMPELERALTLSEENGWKQLVSGIRRIIKGDRDSSILNGMDEEDSMILDAILRGIQNPGTLPDANKEADPALAAPMFAQLIHAAATGDASALSMLGSMAEQMSNTQGDLARFSTLIKPMVDGERDIDRLCGKIGPQGESLVVSIISELAKLDAH
ncbi:MAG: hypothetical protein OEY43_06075 [Gammaproteobacteria bacterium]|nr:hypothetical protein [Gammaproteobacteria bacterium]